MKKKLKIPKDVVAVIAKLQDAGFEAYVVGGAIRDLLLNRKPKDFDLSTSATPEQIRKLFTKKRAKIIGRRFQIIHLYLSDDVVEITTFRKAPKDGKGKKACDKKKPKEMLFRDNDFGTSFEDAFRRDFTANALFYDPIKEEIIDHTGQGLDDIEKGIVRVIGEPDLRLDEDPVRILRGLKLVGQYGFELEDKTKESILKKLDLITHIPAGRKLLELEKILKSPYGCKILITLQEYGYLKFYMPNLSRKWNKPEMNKSLKVYNAICKRVKNGNYRNSISLSMAAILYPLIEAEMSRKKVEFWDVENSAKFAIKSIGGSVFKDFQFSKWIKDAAFRIIEMLPYFVEEEPDKLLFQRKKYNHARELITVLNDLFWNDKHLMKKWPKMMMKKEQKNSNWFR